MKHRSGPWSREEKEFIAENCSRLSVEEIAASLRRSAIAIKQYIRKELGRKAISSTSMIKAEYDIQGSPIWKELQGQFTSEELTLFMYHWKRIIGQFKDDVFPTEELQVVDTIKLELLMSRCLKNEHDAVVTIKKLESETNQLEQTPFDQRTPEDRVLIDTLSRQTAFHRASLQTLSKDYNDFAAKKSGMLKDLRATRSERVKRIEESKHTFTGCIIDIMNNRQLRTELGEYMEKMRIGIDLEKVRLMDPHKFSDGMIDHPVLNSDTVEYLQKKEDIINNREEEPNE